MKNWFAPADTLSNKISYYHLLFFLALLPFDRFYSELVLISLALHTIIHLRRSNFENFDWKKLLLAASVFAVTMISSCYSQDWSRAFSMWSRQLAILLFPLIFLLNPIRLEKYWRSLLHVFSLVCVAVILYLYLDAFRVMHYYQMPAHSLFTASFLNHNFSAPIGIHATYLSLYCGLACIHVLNLLARPFPPSKKMLIGAVLLVLLAGLIQLGSRSVLIGLAVVAAIEFPLLILRNKGLSLLVLALLGIGSVSVFQMGSLRHRFLTELRSDLQPQRGAYSITDPRAERWGLAWQLVKEAPVVGHGAGEEVSLLREKYFEHKLYNSYLFSLNAHNQYLSFWIRAGIWGLSVYLLTIFLGFRTAVSEKDPVFLGFLSLIAVVSVSENFLDVNKGIFFYAFFFSLFICKGKRLKKKSLAAEDKEMQRVAPELAQPNFMS